MSIKLAAALDNFDARSAEFGLVCSDPSLAQQSFKDETDINVIVDRFMKTGVLPDPVRLPQYVDVTSGVFDYKAAMNMIRQADEAFMSMDAKVRSRFHNSPSEFLEFFADPANAEEAVRLGLVVAKPTSSVAVATDEAPASKPE